MCCSALFCDVLSCVVLLNTYCLVDQTHPKWTFFSTRHMIFFFLV